MTESAFIPQFQQAPQRSMYGQAGMVPTLRYLADSKGKAV
jgi:hypothetical protein